MPLTAGTRLGPYEVLSAIGAGGMGEVYKAHDTTLNRAVALKVLPDLFANDAERLARFRQEAQVLAALNHPNIAQIYGFEESNDVHALVMEFVEGVTLAEKLAGKGVGSGLSALGSGPGNAQGLKPKARERFTLPTRSRLPARSPKRSKPRTRRASFIAISNQPTSRSRPTGR